jgi:hypothetical protein
MLRARHEGPEDHFTVVPNEVFRNPKLTGNAVKLLGYLLSYKNFRGVDGKPWEYRLSVMEQLVRSRRALESARKCLIENGYLTESRTKSVRGVRRFQSIDWVFYSYPITKPESTEDVLYGINHTVLDVPVIKKDLEIKKEKELNKVLDPYDSKDEHEPQRPKTLSLNPFQHIKPEDLNDLF